MAKNKGTANVKATTERGLPVGAFRAKITAYRCRCGHEWLGKRKLSDRSVRPRVCPECHSPHWDRPYLHRRNK